MEHHRRRQRHVEVFNDGSGVNYHTAMEQGEEEQQLQVTNLVRTADTRLSWEVFNYATNEHTFSMTYLVDREEKQLSCEVFTYAINVHILRIS